MDQVDVYHERYQRLRGAARRQAVTEDFGSTVSRIADKARSLKSTFDRSNAEREQETWSEFQYFLGLRSALLIALQEVRPNESPLERELLADALLNWSHVRD